MSSLLQVTRALFSIIILIYIGFQTLLIHLHGWNEYTWTSDVQRKFISST